MKEEIINQALDQLDDVIDNPPPTVSKTMESFVEQLAKVEPGIFEQDDDVDAWAAGLLHSTLMSEASGNRLTIEETADQFGCTEYKVGQRSRDFRHKTNSPALDAVGDMLGADEELDSGEQGVKQLMDQLMGTPAPASRSSGESTTDFSDLVERISLQVTVEGRFDLEQFQSDHGLSDDRMDEFIDYAQSGLEHYLDFMYEGPNEVDANWQIEERLGNPHPFGYVVLEAVRREGTEPLLDILCCYVVNLVLETNQRPEVRIPHGALVPVAWLERQGTVTGDRLFDLMERVLADKQSFTGLDREDGRMILKAVATDPDAPSDDRRLLLTHLLDHAGNTSNNHLPVQLLKDVLDKEWLSGDDVSSVLEDVAFPGQKKIGMIPAMPSRSTRQEALKRLSNHKPLDILVERVFDHEQGHSTQNLLEVVPTVIRENNETVPESTVDDWIERGISVGNARTRKAFYELAHERFGADILEDALEDRADSVSDWAKQQIED